MTGPRIFSTWIPAGTYWLICDTYRVSGSDRMGDYTLSMSFTSDVDEIFSDSFETGDTSGWSSEAGK